MLQRPIRRALVPLVLLATMTVGSAAAAVEPVPPEPGSTAQAPAEGQPVTTPPDLVPLPTVMPDPVPDAMPDVMPVPEPDLAPVPPPAPDPGPGPGPEPVPAPEPVPPTVPEPPREPEPAPPPVVQPPPLPVPPPPPLWLPLPGRAVACNAVTGPVPLEHTVVASGIRVHTCLASRVQALVAMAASHSVVLTGGGWRSNQRQIELRRAHCGTSDYAIWSMPSGRCSPPTARPGQSRHERGLAIDFNNCSTRASVCWGWLNHHAPLFGLYNLPSEPWHWSVDGH